MGVGRARFQAVQIAGALAILVAFACAQLDWLDQKSVAYLLLNLIVSSVLGIQAVLHKEWGFVLLESVWALISAAGLLLRG
jgi:hypothetical protein